MNSRIPPVLTVLAALAVLTGPSASGSVAEPVEHLRLGAAPRITYSDGDNIYPRGGTRIATLGPAALLGPSDLGWIVWRSNWTAGGVTDILSIVLGDGSSRDLYQHVQPADPADGYPRWYRLSDDRALIAELIGRPGTLTVRTLGNHVVATTRARRILDFTGPRMILDRRSTWSWRPGRAPLRIDRRHANFADVQHDLVSLRARDGRYGLTKLSHPSRLRWKARFRPDAASPDGTKVVGVHVTAHHREILQVRRVRNGAVLAHFLVHGKGYPARWEDNHTVLFNEWIPQSDGFAKRCTLRSRRDAATVPSVYGVNFPFQDQVR
jgi:hypothetical protein